MQGGERGGRAGRGQDDFDRSGDLNQVTPTDSTFSVLFCWTNCSASLKDVVFISLPVFTHSLINLFVYLFIYIQRGEHFQSKLWHSAATPMISTAVAISAQLWPRLLLSPAPFKWWSPRAMGEFSIPAQMQAGNCPLTDRWLAQGGVTFWAKWLPVPINHGSATRPSPKKPVMPCLEQITVIAVSRAGIKSGLNIF